MRRYSVELSINIYQFSQMRTDRLEARLGLNIVQIYVHESTESTCSPGLPKCWLLWIFLPVCTKRHPNPAHAERHLNMNVTLKINFHPPGTFGGFPVLSVLKSILVENSDEDLTQSWTHRNDIVLKMIVLPLEIVRFLLEKFVLLYRHISAMSNDEIQNHSHRRV